MGPGDEAPAEDRATGLVKEEADKVEEEMGDVEETRMGEEVVIEETGMGEEGATKVVGMGEGKATRGSKGDERSHSHSGITDVE